MLSAMEKAKNALTVTLDTLEKSLYLPAVNKGIVKRKLETLQKHYDHFEELHIETEVEEEGIAAAASDFEKMTEKFYEMAARVDVILAPEVPPPQPARQRSNSTSSTGVMD
jgi:predicted RecB family endonuclease